MWIWTHAADCCRLRIESKMENRRIINQKIDDRYVDLFRSLYGNEKNIEYFVSDIQQSIDYCHAEKNILTIISEEGGVLLGHCSLILPKNENDGIAYFGFFELTSKKVFEEFWKSVVAEAKNLKLKKLIGPVNGSIWFPYRFIATSDGSQLFKGELPTDLAYHDCFAHMEQGRITTYSSGVREKYDFIIDATMEPYELVKRSGLEITALKEMTAKLLEELQIISTEVFASASVAYEPFPGKYFLQLYGGKPSGLFRVYLASDAGKIVGFCFMIYEDEQTAILKTLAVHPVFQKRGIASALIHVVHRDAKKEGIEKIIYALVRDDNNIKAFPENGVSIIRTYSLFDLNI